MIYNFVINQEWQYFEIFTFNYVFVCSCSRKKSLPIRGWSQTTSENFSPKFKGAVPVWVASCAENIQHTMPSRLVTLIRNLKWASILNFGCYGSNCSFIQSGNQLPICIHIWIFWGQSHTSDISSVKAR